MTDFRRCCVARLPQLDTAFHLAVQEGGVAYAADIARIGYAVTQFLGQHGRAKDWARRYVVFYMASFGRYSFSLPAYWRFTRMPSQAMFEDLALQAYSWLEMRTNRTSTIPDEPVSRDLRELYDDTFGRGCPITVRSYGGPLSLLQADPMEWLRLQSAALGPEETAGPGNAQAARGRRRRRRGRGTQSGPETR